jgi:hypothetical protein|tara:strand:- start:6674 stop:7237 length:564 start_codon:yes stop_codon:yes gene_type:complete
MSGYIMDNVLSEEELNEARDLAASLKFYKVFQMYNLFDMERADLKVSDEFEFGFLDTLMKYSKHKHCIGVYFLRYVKGSFTRMHHDNNTDLTIVTLLDDVDLVGGHSLVMERYAQRARPGNEYCVRNGGEETHPPYGREITPDVLPVSVGESLIYGPDLKHGVSKVYEGERLVLVAWFSDKDKEERE